MLVFNKTAVEVCEGQQMDMDFETRNDVTIEEYIEMIRLKTSVLLGGALEMGAIIAGASESDRKKLYTFGQELGLAFQIKDDYLDLYGDPEKFGKQIGGDVISNKKTLLYLLALENANTQQREIFRQLEDESDLDLKVRNVRQLFDQFEIPNLAQAQMDKHFEKGMTALNEISVPKDNKKDLIDLSHYLMGREN